MGFSDTIHTLEIAKALLASLITGETTYKTKNFDEKTSVNEMKTNGLTVPYGWYFICKLKTMYFLEEISHACFYGDKAQKEYDKYIDSLADAEYDAIYLEQ